MVSWFECYKQFFQTISIDLIDLLFICFSFVLLRSFAVFCDLAPYFCDIFAILCDFLRSYAIFCGLLRLSADFCDFSLSIEVSSAIFCNFFYILRCSACFCGLLRSSAVFLDWFNISFCSLPQSSASAVLSEKVILSAMTVANTYQSIFN